MSFINERKIQSQSGIQADLSAIKGCIYASGVLEF